MKVSLGDLVVKMPISFDGKTGDFGACVAHFVSKGKSKESASSMCGSIEKRQQKQLKIIPIKSNIAFKEEKGEFYSEGFIATTHQDKEGDILSEHAIHTIVDQINNPHTPDAGVASDRHDWIKEQNPDLPIAGRAISADVRDTGDGHTGAYVKTHHHKFHPEFDEIKYNVEHDYYPGYSIEFETLADHEVENGRVIDDLNLAGYGFANARLIANPYAEIVASGYKEMMSVDSVKALHHTRQDIKKTTKKKKNNKGDNKMKNEKELKKKLL